MNDDIPNITPVPPNPEQMRLKATFDELRKNQLTYLNDAGKRVIELCTGMLTVLFAVVAFGKDFPPPYLADPLTKILAIATLVFILTALVSGFFCVQPQEYKDYPNNLKAMQDELQSIYQWKALWFRIGSILFGLGAFLLASLVVVIIL